MSTWTPLVNQPTFNASTMLLLTDGTVMCQNAGQSDWHRLTPDAHGSYVNGTWSALASTVEGPLYYASAVLRDGRVFRAGGEYNFGVSGDIDNVDIFDPIADSWTTITPPAGVTFGDCVSCVLNNGRVLLGNLSGSPQVYDPVANTFTATGAKSNGTTDEETWTLLPDGSVFTLDCFGHPHAERYVPASNSWVSAGNSPVDLVFDVPKEIGPALLLPDGRVFCIGDTGKTVFYTLGSPGTFTAGPVIPSVGGKQLGAMDAPAALMPNGNVLLAVGPVDNSNNYQSPTYLYEYDPATNAYTSAGNPGNAGGQPYVSRMLLLPTGQVLFAAGTHFIAVYTPSGGPQTAWRPLITSCPTSVVQDHSYTLQGRQLNGLSQACSYGDDAQMATNYPIVRLEYASGQIVYCRTANHSTMGVATGSAIVSTSFTVPSGAPSGSANLVVVANGIPSLPYAVHVGIVKKIEKIEKIEKVEHVEKLLVADKVQKVEIAEKPIAEQGKWSEKLAESNPGFTEQLQQLATQVSQLGATVQQHQAFIAAQERPAVGEPPAEVEPASAPPPRRREHPQP